MNEDHKVLFWADDFSVEERINKKDGVPSIMLNHPDISMLLILTKQSQVLFQTYMHADTDMQEITLPWVTSENTDKPQSDVVHWLEQKQIKYERLTLISSLSVLPEKFLVSFRIYLVTDAKLPNLDSKYMLSPLQTYENHVTQGKLKDVVSITALNIVKNRFYELTK